jgi:ribosomal protein S18 acetylase RimI-like enzyme
MRSRYVDGITIRPLRDGDVETVEAVFERLGERSLALRFGAATPRLDGAELDALARVDGTHHSLVAYVDGDPRPVGLAQLVRDGASAEIAFAVADEHQGHGIGRILSRELAADARAAGIRELRANVRLENHRAVSLVARGAGRRLRPGGECEFVLPLDAAA